MPEYTPTTNEVREDFVYPWEGFKNDDRDGRLAAFDRWLAEVVRLNREIGWDEGFGAAYHGTHTGDENPYRGDDRAEPGPTCVECGQPSTYRLGMPEPSWCDAHGPKPKGAPHV